MGARFTAAPIAFLALLASSPRPVAGADPAGPWAVVAGIVVDEAGAPAGGVTVEVLPIPIRDDVDLEGALGAEDAWWKPAAPAPAIATATAGADGRFRVGGLDPARRVFVRVAPAAGRASDPVLTHPATPFDLVRLVVRADAEVVVRVVDADGRPVVATVVATIPRARAWYEARGASLPSVRTGADGRGRLVGLPRGRLHLDACAPGVAVVRDLGFDAPSTGEVLVRLGDATGVAAEGTVRDPAGAPIAGARVAVGTHPARVDVEDPETIRLAVTDAAGRWRVAGLPPGVLLGVGARAAGFVPIFGVDARRRADPKEPLRFGMTLGRGAVVEGLVVGPEGQAFPGARVFVAGESAVTDAAGRWRIDGVPLGPEEIRVRAPGFHLPYSPASIAWNVSGGTWVEARTAGVVRAPDLRLRRGVHVEGRVVDEGGMAVAGAWVRAESRRAGHVWNEAWLEAAVVRANDDGGFSMEGLIPGDDWTVEARADGLASDPMRESALRDEDRAVRVELVARRLGRLSGRIVDLEGKPAPGVEIETEGPEGHVTTSGADGRFAFGEVRAGEYRVQATYGRRRRKDVPGTPRAVAPGEDASDVVLALDPPKPLAGVVVDEKGSPVAGLAVSIEADEPMDFADRWSGPRMGWSSWTVTDGRGRFRFENLSPGGYEIRPRRENGGDTVKAGDEGVRLVSYRDAVPVVDGARAARRGWDRWDTRDVWMPLEGTVVDPAGKPVARAVVRVTIRFGGGSQGFSATAVNGAFRTTVPSKAETIDVEAEQARDASGTALDFAPGEVTGLAPAVGRVVVRLAPGRAIAGRLVDDAEKPVAGALVWASWAGTGDDPSAGVHGQAATGADGSFRVVGLPAGAFTLQAAPGDAWWPARLAEAAGSDGVVLRLGRSAWIFGRVVDERGAPLAGLDLQTGRDGTLGHEDGRGRSSFDGTFRLGPVSGAASVIAPTDWGSSEERATPRYAKVVKHDVAPGTKDLEIRLTRVYRVSGVVVGPDGKPVRDVEVRLDPEPADAARAPVVAKKRWDEEGFSIEAPPGLWKLTATTKEWNGRDEKARTTSVVVTCPSEGVRLRFEEEEAVSGRLVGEGAGGFGIVLVAASPAGPTVAAAAPDEDGRFRVVTTDRGPFLLYASCVGDDRYALGDGFEPGRASRDLPLVAGGRIEGRLEGATASLDADRSAVWARSPRGLVAHGSVGDDGRFVVSGLPPGETWTIEARAFDRDVLLLGSLGDVASGATGLALPLARR